MIVGVSDCPVHLQRRSHHLQHCASSLCLQGGYGGRVQFATIDVARGAECERVRKLEADVAVDQPMLQGLKTSDGFAELMSKLDVVQGEIKRICPDPNELGADGNQKSSSNPFGPKRGVVTACHDRVRR